MQASTLVLDLFIRLTLKINSNENVVKHSKDEIINDKKLISCTLYDSVKRCNRAEDSLVF